MLALRDRMCHALMACNYLRACVHINQHAMEAVKNMTLACCGGGELLCELTLKNIAETLFMLETQHLLPELDVARIKEFMQRSCSGVVSQINHGHL